MSVPSSGPAGLHAPASVAAAVLAAATILTQITYPLLSGEPLRISTIATVLLFAAASVTHAAATHGPGAALRLLGVAGGIGLAAEAVGVATGFPFGTYAYAGTLGPTVLGVPLVVPLAWSMMAYPCLLLGRRLALLLPAGAGRRVATVVVGAWTLAAWDLYLDPQMVAAGHWSWAYPAPALPGVPGVPLTNYAGWVLVAVVMTAVLDRALPVTTAAATDTATDTATATTDAASQAVPALLLAWTWLGSALGNLVFFDRPAVAGYGVLAMGVTTLPYLRQLIARRSTEGRR